MRFTRRRDSRQLQVRGTGGRYIRKPSLGAEVCKHCNGFVLPAMGEGPFPMPEWPRLCKQCGKNWRKSP